MSSLHGVHRQDKILADEHIFHQKHCTFEEFCSQIDRIHILNDRDLPNPNKSDGVSITIDYRMRRDNGRNIYGVLQPKLSETSEKAWTLVCFMSLETSKNASNGSKWVWKSKSERKMQKLSDERSCDPKPGDSATGIIRISYVFTSEIGPKRVIQLNQMNRDMVYGLISKGIALMKDNVILKNLWIFSFDFRDPTGAILYCCAYKQENDALGYGWTFEDEVYTADQVIARTGLAMHQLPTTIRQSKGFLSKLKRVATIESMLNDKQHQADIFHDKIAWQHLPVFIDDRKVNKTQRKCTKTKKVFLNDCTTFIANCTSPITVVPVLYFNLAKDRIDIDAGWRVCIDNFDMVITFKYMDRNQSNHAPYIRPTAIHLDVERVVLMHHLVDGGTSKTTYFDGWKSPFNDFAIGNRKDDENKYKAKSKDCARYKQSDHALKVLIHDLKPVMNDHPTVAHAVRRAETASGIAHVDQEEETKYDAVLHVAKWQANRPNLLHRSEMVPPIAPMSLSYSIPPPMPPLYLPMSMPLIYNVQYVSFPLLGSIAPLPPMFMFPMTLYPMQTTPVVAMGNPPMINTPNPQASASIPIQNALDPRYGCK
eukprot:999106_1